MIELSELIGIMDSKKEDSMEEEQMGIKKEISIDRLMTLADITFTPNGKNIKSSSSKLKALKNHSIIKGIEVVIKAVKEVKEEIIVEDSIITTETTIIIIIITTTAAIITKKESFQAQTNSRKAIMISKMYK